MSFNDEEIAYLQSQPLARLATVDPGGQPDVVPIALDFDVDAGHFWVGGGDVLATRKFRNVTGRNDRVAFVVDDMESVDPFIARGLRVYGSATGPIERVGMVGPGQFLMITPITSWSWNMAGEPLVGSSWYPVRRTEH